MSEAEILIGAGAGALAMFGMLRSMRFLSRKESRKEEVCAGYQGANVYADMKHDCRALRSPLCGDGRCAFHCRAMCKCEASNEPEFIGRSR
jgi:hypothetical protein